MRKTLNINIGGIAFIIDENAFELLHNYLEALKKKFSNEAERQEILNDIEARIAEMLSQKLADRKEVVSITEVQAIMDAMGKPEDIAGEETDATTTNTAGPAQSATQTVYEPIKKRLFRDADDAKVAGVIAGLCHYFGINDPVWMRIAAVILIFVTSGSIILLYLLLVIIVPKALTSAEKLQMKGEPVNINTIEKEIKDSFTRTGETVNRFVKDDTFFEKAGNTALSILKVLLRIAVAGLLVWSIFMLMCVIVIFVASYILGTSQFNDVSQLLVEGKNTISLLSFGFLLFFGVPFLALIYLALRVFTGHKSRVTGLKWVLLSAWFIGFILLSLTGYRTAKNFRTSVSKQEQTPLMQPAAGTLYVMLSDNDGKPVDAEEEEALESFNVSEDGVFVNGVNIKDLKQIPVAKPALELMVSANDSFYIQKIVTARGKTSPEAKNHAAATIYSYSQTDTILNLNPYLYIDKTGKWRAQSLKIRLAIPEGKKIRFANNIDLWTAVVKGDRNYDDTYFAGTTWTVENGKLKCIGGENHFNANKQDNLDEDESDKGETKDDKKADKEEDEDDSNKDY
ncbi:MAG: PspC domain-containing protein [Chitinophagales bacterium]|nr:PspC domain-containing protein [Chitinophagales bacterium]